MSDQMLTSTKVNIATLCTVVASIATGAVYVGVFINQVHAQDSDISRVEATANDAFTKSTDLDKRTAVLEANIATIKNDISEIKGILKNKK